MVAGSSPAGCAIRPLGKQVMLYRDMVGVAQLVERWIVIPVVVGSIPIVHPIFYEGASIVDLAPLF